MRNLSLYLDGAEWASLRDSIEDYLNGNGMLDGDPDETALESILDRLRDGGLS